MYLSAFDISKSAPKHTTDPCLSNCHSSPQLRGSGQTSRLWVGQGDGERGDRYYVFRRGKSPSCLASLIPVCWLGGIELWLIQGHFG